MDGTHDDGWGNTVANQQRFIVWGARDGFTCSLTGLVRPARLWSAAWDDDRDENVGDGVFNVANPDLAFRAFDSHPQAARIKTAFRNVIPR